MKKYFLFVFLPVLAFSLSGCFKKPAEKAVEKQISDSSGNKANVEINDKGAKISFQDEGGNGEIKIDTEGGLDLPKGWPDYVKVYPARAISNVTSDEGINFVQQTYDSPEDVIAWYDNQYKDWDQVAAMDIGGSVMRAYDRGSESFSIVVTTTDDKTMISNTYLENK